MGEVYYRGEYLDASQPAVSITNRGFHYGDGFFETIRIMNGEPVFIENHFARIQDTLKAYKINASQTFSMEMLKREIMGLCHRNGINQGGRVRITFTRKGDGFYLPLTNDLEYLIEAYPLPNNEFKLNEKGIHVDLCSDFKKDVNKLAIYKRLDCQVYIQASLFAQEKGLDEALIQNYKGSIIESSSSNIFLVSTAALCGAH